MKKKVLLILICIIFIFFIYYKINYKTPDLPYTQEYIVGNSNIQGNVDLIYFSNKHKAFEIAANKNGQAVFKDPEEAFKTLKNNYTIGLKKIQKTYNLLPINQMNFNKYGDYAWQITNENTEEEQEQLNFITSFIDIYENSFN